ncbi:MAG: hypothetical protein GX057_05675 [Clostridiales bacterium]|nr:hypothetical protein [Clostridiales bacterium]HOA85534.1 hypothetical protein [Bacillota bacterium]
MPIQKFTVSRDDAVYEAWPGLVLTRGGIMDDAPKAQIRGCSLQLPDIVLG